jgi:hypothetical protein
MIKGDPIEPSRLEHYYKQITMKYRENKSNIIEYKQKEIQEKKPIACTLTLYKEEHGGSSSQWGRKKLNNGRRTAKLARRRLAETAKKLTQKQTEK